MDVWGFIWIMVVLKAPLIGLLFLVWYAVRATPDIDDEDHGDDGGSKRPNHPPGRPHRRPRPRGPHGDPAIGPPPPRVRTVVRGREHERDG